MVALLGQKVIFTIGDYLGLYNEAFGTPRKASEPFRRWKRRPPHGNNASVRLLLSAWPWGWVLGRVSRTH